MSKTDHEITFETSELLTSRINPSIILWNGQDFEYPTIVGENIQIYTVQITEEQIICEPPPPHQICEIQGSIQEVVKWAIAYFQQKRALFA